MTVDLRRIGNVWDCVGATPLIRIESLSHETGCEILGKAEYLNPGGSVKDRAAKGIIDAAERDGSLKPGATIVEGTAGNTGIGLATLALPRGYKVILTMPDNQAAEKYQMLEALGVTVRKVPPVPFANPDHFYHQARRLAQEKGFFWADQFENTANGDFHFATTGPEIWEATQGRVDHFVCASGTGGTISGVSRYLKSRNPNVRIALVDPPGSGLYQHHLTGEMKASGSSITEGIGIMRVTNNYRLARIDEALTFGDQDMIEMLYRLAREEGLLLGTSAALNVLAAYRIAQRHRGQKLRIVTILCDHGSRYASKVFNQDWLNGQGLRSPAAPV
jgi:cysteine synthase A